MAVLGRATISRTIQQLSDRDFTDIAVLTTNLLYFLLDAIFALKKEYTDLTPILMNNFDYDEKTETFYIRKNTKFTTHIDVKLRIKYFLTSFLRRMERENKPVTFDEIILEVIPLLKNGTTPENQTVLSVLEDIGQRSGDNYWTLKKNSTQLELFSQL